MNAREAVVSVLLRGLNGMGVGRVEARELARRFGNDFAAVKWHGEWYVVASADLLFEPGETVPHARGGACAWSMAQVADWIWKKDRGHACDRPPAGYMVGRTASEVSPCSAISKTVA